jgi:hypothetical protein
MLDFVCFYVKICQLLGKLITNIAVGIGIMVVSGWIALTKT